MPADLRAEMSRAGSLALPVVGRGAAEPTTSRSSCRHLQRNLELRRRYIDCFDGDYDEPYDVLLDDYERGHDDAPRCATLFAYLKEAPVAARAGGRRTASRSGAAGAHVPARAAEGSSSSRWSSGSASTTSAWRLDPTVHPFATGDGIDGHPAHDALLRGQPRRPLRDDARVRARALRAPGRRATLERTPLARGASLGLHESQSRMWENLVGRSLPFWRFFYPAAAGALPGGARAASTLEDWYREVNAVEPSLIRVEADEATYNLHIILRFELEQELIAETFPLDELPEEWNERMWEYLGVELPERHARRAAGHALGDGRDRLLPDLRARQPHLGAALGAGPRPSCRTSTTSSSAGEFGTLARMAARAPPPPRPQVHAAETLGAAHRRRARPGAVPALPPRQARRRCRV